MANLLAPDTGNYTIGKGSVYFTPTGGAKRHLGNVPSVAFQLQTTKLDHFSSQSGVKKKDKTVVTEVTGTLDMTLEELNLENVQLALLGGDIAPNNSTEGAGNLGFIIGAVTEKTGEIEVVMSNEVGPKWTYIYPNCSIQPSNAVDFIGDAWATLPLSVDVLSHDFGGGVTGFGQAIQQDSATG